MNAEELKKEFGIEFPTEINGYKRPDEPLDSDNDWYIKIPQLIAKDKVLYTGMNLILSTLLSNEKLLKQWHDTLQDVVNAQDWRIVTDSLKGYMTPELKKKLDGIATGANNYVHPSSHPASMITQDATHRLVTDTEKSTWNGKASTAVVSTTTNGLAPKRDGEANHFLAGDGAWKTVASATKATQDKNGKDITGYLYKTENITLHSDTKPIVVGNILTILNAFCSKFKTIQGTPSYAENPPTNIKSLNDNKAPKASPALTGTPTAPTPATTDDSTKLATTAFVRNLINQLKNNGTLSSIVGSSVSHQGWIKFNNGLTIQWGTVSGSPITYPIVFANNVFLVGCFGSSNNGGVYGYSVTTTSWNTAQATFTGVHNDSRGHSDNFDVGGRVFYIAIGN